MSEIFKLPGLENANASGLFSLELPPEPVKLERGYFAVEIISAKSGLSKKMKPMLTVRMEATKGDQRGEVAVWIGEWNTDLFIALMRMAGVTEIPAAGIDVAKLVGVKGYALLDDDVFGSRPVSKVTHLLTREKLIELGVPLPCVSCTAGFGGSALELENDDDEIASLAPDLGEDDIAA